MDLQSQLDLWSRQAAEAIDAGVPKEKVLGKLRKMYESVGVTADFGNEEQEDPNFNRKSAPWESSTVAQQANSVRMSPNEMYATGQFDPKPQDAAKAADPSFLEKAAAVAEPYSPLTGLLDPSNPVSSAFRNTGYGLLRGLNMAAGGVAARGKDLLSHVGIDVDSSPEDYFFKKAQDLKQEQQLMNQGFGEGDGVGGFAGRLVANVGVPGGELLSRGQDIVDAGGSTGQAATGELAAPLVNLASLGVGKFVPGGLLSRVLTQAGANVALTEGARVGENKVLEDLPEMQQPFSWGNVGTTALFAGLGGIAEPAAKAKAPAPKIPKTPYPEFNAGVEAYQAGGETKNIFNFDNDTIQAAMKGQSMKVGPAVTFDRITQPSKMNLGSVTDAEISADVPKSNLGPTNQLRKVDQPLDSSGLTYDYTAEVEGGPPQDVSNVPSTAVFPKQNVEVTVGEPDSTAAMQKRRETFSEPVPDIARTEVPESKIKLPSLKQAYRLGDNGEPVLVDNPIKPRTQRGQRDALIAELKALASGSKDELATPSATINSGLQSVKVPSDPAELLRTLAQQKIAPDLWDKFTRGEATVGDTLASIVLNKHGYYDAMPEFRGLVGEMLTRAKALGIENEKLKPFDSPAEKPYVSDKLINGRALAEFSPELRMTLFGKGMHNIGVWVHEIEHHITANAILLGEQDKLPPAQQLAYQTLDNLFNDVRDQLDAGRQVALDADKNPTQRYTDGSVRRYALTDLAEFMAELKRSQELRNTLKNMPLNRSKVPAATYGSLGRIKNYWDAIVKSVSKMIGINPKMENYFDALYAAGTDFTKGLTKNEVRPLKQKKYNRPIEAPNAEAAQAEPLPTQQDKGFNVIRGLFGGGNKTVRAAKERSKAEAGLAQTESDQWARKVQNEIKANPDKADLINEALGVLADNRAGPKAKAAYNALASISPGMKEVADRVMQISADSRKIGLYQLNGAENSDRRLNLAEKSIKGADSYSTITYAIHQIKDFGQRVKKNYDTGKAALASGKELSPSQEQAVENVDAVKAWLKDKVFTDKSKIADIDEATDQAVDYLLGLDTKGANETLRAFKNLQTTAEVHAVRTDVPPVLRKLWGEESSPVVRIAETMRKQGSVIAQEKAMKDVYDAGMGKFLTDKMGVKGYTAQIQGESYGPLNGMYTTPEMKDLIEGFIQQGNFLGDFGRALLADPTANAASAGLAFKAAKGLRFLTGARKTLDIVGNLPMAATRNLIGSPVQLMTNGNMNVSSMARGALAMKDLIGTSKRIGMNEYAREVSRLGLAEASQLSEAFSPVTKEALAKLSESSLSALAQPGSKEAIMDSLRQLKYSAREISTIVKEIYGAMDLWTKFGNYFNELDFRTKQAEKANGKPLSAEQLEAVKKQTADLINNTNVTPSRAYMVAKLSDAVGATAFLPYAAEIVRTTGNNVAYGLRDFTKGALSGNIALATHGAKRLIGTTAAVGYMNGVYSIGIKAAGGLLGLVASKANDDPDAKKYLETVDQFKGGDPIILKDEHGNQFVIDGAQFNPVDQAARPTQAIMKAIGMLYDGDKEGAIKAAKDAADMAIHSVGQNSLWAYGKKIVTGSAPSWAKDNPELYGKALSAYREAGISDTTANGLLSTVAALSPKLLNNYLKGGGEDSTVGKALVQSGSGGKEYDPMKDVRRYAGAIANKGIAEAKSEYLNMLKQNINTNADQVRPAFEKGLKGVAENISNLKAAVDAAKARGTSMSDIVQSLQYANVPNELTGMLLSKKPLPAVIMAGSIEADLRKDMYDAKTPEKKKEAAQRYANAVQIMMQLVKENVNKGPEDILNGK